MLGATAGVRASPDWMRPFPRAMPVPPFSGPRSRGATEVHNGLPRHHRPSSRTARTPRMGPPTGGTTTALLPPTVAGHELACHQVAGAGGSGYGRRPHSRCPGCLHAWLVLMALRVVDHSWCPASVGRRTYPGPPALARSLACPQRRTANNERQQRVDRSGSLHKVRRKKADRQVRNPTGPASRHQQPHRTRPAITSRAGRRPPSAWCR